MSERGDCIFNSIKMVSQKLTQEIFDELKFNLYKNIMFSTFPYITYKQSQSISCLNKYNSGNCIAICNFTYIYLKRNFDIDSYIIPASTPRECKVLGTPHMSHCAILIPTSLHEFCIFDGSLFFNELMYCNLKNNTNRKILLSDIYNHSPIEVEYIIRDCDRNICLDKQFNQTLIEDTIYVSCNYSQDKSNIWNYYLNEIVNPDDNIGKSFIINKPNPFLLFSEYEKNNCYLKYKIELQNDGDIKITEYPGKTIIFNGNSIEFKNNPISNKLMRYFSREIVI